jgi:hypothetical protein
MRIVILNFFLQDVRPSNYFTNFVLTLLVVCYLQVTVSASVLKRWYSYYLFIFCKYYSARNWTCVPVARSEKIMPKVENIKILISWMLEKDFLWS